EEGNGYTALIGPKPLQALAYRGMGDRKARLPERVHNQSGRIAIGLGKEGSVQRSGRPKRGRCLVPSPGAERFQSPTPVVALPALNLFDERLTLLVGQQVS